jgi:hypothetical protein
MDIRPVQPPCAAVLTARGRCGTVGRQAPARPVPRRSDRAGRAPRRARSGAGTTPAGGRRRPARPPERRRQWRLARPGRERARGPSLEQAGPAQPVGHGQDRDDGVQGPDVVEDGGAHEEGRSTNPRNTSARLRLERTAPTPTPAMTSAWLSSVIVRPARKPQVVRRAYRPIPRRPPRAVLVRLGERRPRRIRLRRRRARATTDRRGGVWPASSGLAQPTPRAPVPRPAPPVSQRGGPPARGSCGARPCGVRR